MQIELNDVMKLLKKIALKLKLQLLNADLCSEHFFNTDMTKVRITLLSNFLLQSYSFYFKKKCKQDSRMVRKRRILFE